jgi:hypothetical protein
MLEFITKARQWLSTEYGLATQELHDFLNWVEQKQKKLEDAKALLEANGYDVTVKVPPVQQ